MSGSRPTLFTPAFISLSLAELAYFTCAGLIVLVTPLFAVADDGLGVSKAAAGFAVGAFSVTAIVLRPVAGRLSDRIGRKPLLVGGALVFAGVTAAHAVTNDFAVLIVLRLLLGAAEAFFFVAGFAALADLAPENRTGEALSFNSLSLYLGVAIGPSIGEWLIGVGGFDMAWVGGASLAFVAALLALRMPETRVRDVDAPATPLFHPAAIGPGLALFSGVTGMAVFLPFVVIDARELHLAGAGNVLFVFGAVVIVCRVAFARLPDRMPPFRLARIALVLIAAGLLLAALVRSDAGLLVGGAVLAIGVALITPACFAALFQRVPPAERGSASGTASLFLDLAFGGGPMVMGLVANEAGIAAAYAAAAALALVGAMVSLGGAVLRSRPQPAS